ncbi:MAG: Imm26 family immunity protein [Ilyomonas sp.]
MTKFTKVKTGDLIKVPLRQDAWTYARILIEGSYAFYDCLSTTDRADFEQIIKSDILFIAHVDIFAIKDGHWTIVTNIPLEERLAKLHPRYFNPAPMNQENVNFYEVYKNQIEDAIGKDWIKTGRMQLDGLYGQLHIQARINDYYRGKRNEENKANIWFFKKYLGLTTDELIDFK